MSQFAFASRQEPNPANTAFPQARSGASVETGAVPSQQKTATPVSKSTIRSLDDVQKLVEARGGSSEITAICEKGIEGNSSTFSKATGKLEFSKWNNTRMRGVVAKEHYALGLFLESGPSNTLLKKNLSGGDIIFVKPSCERDAVYTSSMEGAFALVEADHFERLVETRGFTGGVEKLPNYLQMSMPHAMSQFLISSTERSRDGLQQQSMENETQERAISYTHDRFVDNILDCLAMSVDGKYTARDANIDANRLLNNIESFLHESPGEIVTINQLCDHFSVSRVAVRKAFLDTLGVSPGVYIRNWRLSRAREGLQQRHFLSVTDAAMHWGFFDCGRFSGYYFKLFNELPSATLKHVQRASLG